MVGFGSTEGPAQRCRVTSLSISTQMPLVYGSSTAHHLMKVLHSNALNVNNMNVNLGGKQTLICDTIILLTNPDPEIGKIHMHGLLQTMVCPHDHPDPNLAGKAKGMAAVVKEIKSVYKRLVDELRGEKVVGKCGQYRKSAAKKRC